MNNEIIVKLLELLLDDPKESKNSECSKIDQTHIGQYVIVRTYSAGVHFGKLKQREGLQVELISARRIWKWSGAFTLSEIAMTGIDSANSKISVLVSSIILTEVIEIIPCSTIAIKQLTEAVCYEC